MMILLLMPIVLGLVTHSSARAPIRCCKVEAARTVATATTAARPNLRPDERRHVWLRSSRWPRRQQ